MKIYLYLMLVTVAFNTLHAGEKRPPNIVLILADDIGIEGVGSYGSESYKTPHLDQMADDGMRFTHAYSQPLCTPTRLEIMTGRDNHRNWSYFGILNPEERTFGHLMKVAGYRTCISGKWQLQSYDPPDFPNAEMRRGTGMQVKNAGFEEYSLFHSWHTEDKGFRYGNPTIYQNGELLENLKGQYGPDINLQFILDFMEKHREEPMFVYYPMELPHWPMVPTPLSKDWAKPELRNEPDPKYFPDMVEYMDLLIGGLLSGIKNLGLDDDTLVLFYSDNGTDQRIHSKFRGQSIRGGKATPLQTGVRVPLIARWPGKIKPHQLNNNLVEASDFLPTLAKLGQVDIPKSWQHDGISFANQLLGKKSNPRDYCFFWYDPRPGWDKSRFDRHIFALDQNYKLFSDGRFFDIQGTGMREVELDVKSLSNQGLLARKKLQMAILEMMKGPISEGAKKLVDAYGNPLKK